MRITTHMMMNNYRNDVEDAFSSMNKALQHTIDYRKFERPSDDPVAASQTFDVHWLTSLNDDYTANVTDQKATITTAEKVLQNVDKLLTNADTTDTLKAVNGDMNSKNREVLADQLTSIRNEIVSQMNSMYSGNYLFGGSNDSDAPFQMKGDQLYYRGINVDTGKLEDGSEPKISLDQLTSEKTYVDIGLGIKVDKYGNINAQSAFDSAMPGISYIGYGVDADGNPKNVCSLLTKISNVLKSSSNEDLLSSSELNSIQNYINTFRDSHNDLRNGQSAVGQKLQFLDSTSNYLTDVNLNLASKDNEVEFLSPYDAIESFYNQSYCYKASLKVGSQVLQQSLMDYLK